MREAQLIILDEPTASLDARAEHEVFVRFAELMKGKAAVLISHRFSTVRMADRILVPRTRGAARAGHPRRTTGQRWEICGVVSIAG
jgi:ABC-type multidrug transport system fused ATPase/permease subunit